MSEDTAVAENNEERSKAKRIAEGIFNLIKDIKLLDENNIDEELFNRFSFYINQIDEVEETEEIANLVYEELGNLLNDGNKSQSYFVNLEEKAFRVYEIRNRNFLILLAEFIARNKYINKKFFYELTVNKNILLHSIYRESGLGQCLKENKYARTKTNDILWLCQILDGLCKKVENTKHNKSQNSSVENTKHNKSQNSSNEKQYFDFLTNLLAFAKRKEFISKELFYDLIFGKLAYDNELCDFAVFFKKIQENNIGFSNDDTKNYFESNLLKFHKRDYATNFNIVFGKVVEIYSFAQRKFGAKANEFTNDFFGNLSFQESLSFDVNSLRKEFDKWSVSRIIKNYELPASELVVLFSFSRKCWFWNRNKNLQRLLKNINDERGLSKIAYTLSNLPKEQIENFYEWLHQNRDNLITENGLSNDFWTHAQNDGFISREQEKLLQLVPLKRQDEFRKLFRNKNFRNVCQTPQAIKNLLTITEVCSLSLIEYINNCLRNDASIEDIRIALDTFDVNKIYDFFEDKFEGEQKKFKKPYSFLCLDNWICYVRDINRIENPKFDESAKKTFLNNCQIAFNLIARERIILELNCDKSGLLIKNMEKLLSKNTMEDYKNRFAGEKIVGADDYEPAAREYLGLSIGDEKVITPFASLYSFLSEANSEFYKLCNIHLKPNIIADLFSYAQKENYYFLLNEVISFLNEPNAKNLKIKFMKIISEQKKHFITEAFENDTIGPSKFQKLQKKTVEDVLCLINSKEDVYEVFELLKLGFDISKVNFADAYKIISSIKNIANETDKKLLCKEFINIAPNYKNDKSIIKETILLAEELKDKNNEKQIYDYLKSKIYDFKEIIQRDPEFVTKIFLLNLEPKKLSIIFIQLEKIINARESFAFADNFKCHLGANSKVAEALATEENIPKLEAAINRTAARAQ